MHSKFRKNRNLEKSKFLKINILKNLKIPDVVMWCVFGDPSILRREKCVAEVALVILEATSKNAEFSEEKNFEILSQWFFSMKIFQKISEIFPMIFPMKNVVEKKSMIF